MIVLEPAAAHVPGVTIRLRPNRALSHRGMMRCAWALAAFALATAVMCAYRGNVFAPFFALAQSAAVVWALDVAWRAGDRSERIHMDGVALEVEALPGRRCTRFQAGWVRVLLQPGPGHQRLLLASHGRELEIGAFLGDGERAELSRKLKGLLADLTGRQAL